MAQPIVMLTLPKVPGSLKGIPENAVEKWLERGWERVEEDSSETVPPVDTTQSDEPNEPAAEKQPSRRKAKSRTSDSSEE